MEPHPPPSSTATTTKLRLMCSHGGHIVPRPSSGPNHNNNNNNKSFFYVGGDTRIVSVDRRTVTTIDSLVSHLAAALYVSSHFTLKYQLPHLDLNSLISLTSNEDFYVLIDEYDRLCSIPPSSYPAPSRIRLFLFRMDLGSGRPVIRHPKTEAWFFDALKNATIVGGEGNGVVFLGQESMVLETSSSFGSGSTSSSSSASLTNLALKSQSYEDNNEFVSQTNSVPSDNSGPSLLHYHHQNISFQDPIIVQASSSSLEARVDNYGTETIITSETANNTNKVEVGRNNTSLFPQQNQQQLHTQHVHHFLPLQQITYHQPSHYPHPIDLVPNYAQIIVPHNSTLPITTASNHSSFMASQNCYYYRPPSSSATTSSYGNYKQQTGEMYVPSLHNVAVTNNTEPPDEHGGGVDVDYHDLIYKSQPPPPSSSFPNLNSQYRTVTRDTKVMFYEALAHDQDFK